MLDHLDAELSNPPAVPAAAGGHDSAEDNRRQQGEGDGTFSHDWLLLVMGKIRSECVMAASAGGQTLSDGAVTKSRARLEAIAVRWCYAIGVSRPLPSGRGFAAVPGKRPGP